MTTGKGFADVVFLPYVPNIPALIVELKHSESAESALDQIKDKRYFESLSHYEGNLLFVGINYDEKEKNHECGIERFEKQIYYDHIYAPEGVRIFDLGIYIMECCHLDIKNNQINNYTCNNELSLIKYIGQFDDNNRDR